MRHSHLMYGFAGGLYVGAQFGCFGFGVDGRLSVLQAVKFSPLFYRSTLLQVNIDKSVLNSLTFFSASDDV